MAFIRPYEGEVLIDSLPSAFPGSVAAEAGIPVVAPEGIGEVDEDSGFVTISSERLGAIADADLIVVPDFTVAGTVEMDGVSEFETNPSWSELQR